MHHISFPCSVRTGQAGRATSARQRLRVVAALALAGAVGLPLHAQTADPGKYPERPVRLIVSYAADNVTDTLARIVSDKLSAQ